jgi:hypothetical protein
MVYYFSASTKGFYLKDIHGDNMPEDVVEVSEEEYSALMEGHSSTSSEIHSDENGNPILVPIVIEEPPTPELTYADLRRAEYPPIADYIDGVVKGNQAQIDTYIEACLAVKVKYPKA